MPQRAGETDFLRATLIALVLLGASLQAEPLPEYVRVKVLVHPAGARFLCGMQLGADTPGRLRVKTSRLPEDGLVDLFRGSDFQPGTDFVPVGVDAPGYAPYLTNVSLAELAGQPAPALLWPREVRLTPITWSARLRENPHLPALGLLAALLGAGLAGLSALWLGRRRQGQLRREARLRELGLTRQGLVGRVVDGLHILEELGQGGMATVYRVEPVDRPGQSLALKVLDQRTRDPKYLERFHREVRVCSRLRHPRLVLFHRAVDCEGLLGLLLELVRGSTLRNQVRPGGLPLETVLGWLEAIAQGLHYAHQQGVVHRDLKPENVMLDEQGQLKIMDFGIARLTEGTKLSETNAIIGTVAYMAPEQIAGQPVTPALDQYALGVMLYELLTGEVPYHSEYPFDVCRLHLESPRPDLLAARPDLPAGLQEVLHKMLAVAPQDRFADLEKAVRTLRFAAQSSRR